MHSNINDFQVKKIHVYLNGHKYVPSKKVLINSRRILTWARILDEIAKKIDNIIKVTRLFRIEDGFEVCDFDQLANCGSYVASDQKDFINVGYCDNRSKEKYVNMYSDCSLWLKNVQNNLIDVRSDLLVIYVVKNTSMCQKPPKIVLSQNDLKKWSQILNYIDKTLDLHGETTKFLYTLNGKIVCGPWELQHGGLYIAVGNSNKYYPWECCDINYAKQVWKYGRPFFQKPKLEVCYHKKYNRMESWKQNVSWKRFNLRYSDQIIDCSKCQSKHLCMPICNCEDGNLCKAHTYQNILSNEVVSKSCPCKKKKTLQDNQSCVSTSSQSTLFNDNRAVRAIPLKSTLRAITGKSPEKSVRTPCSARPENSENSENVIYVRSRIPSKREIKNASWR